MSDFFDRLARAAADDWRAYTQHRFFTQLADGTLPAAAFRRYLVQDHHFLIQMARVHGLAVYKAEDLPSMRAEAGLLMGLLDQEMDLHAALCARFGVTADDLAASEASLSTMAYCRFVLDAGMAGDSLDLAVAILPCVAGYHEIAGRLAEHPSTRRASHPYAGWLAAHAGPDLAAVADGARAHLDRLAEARATPARIGQLIATFAMACRLEAAFMDALLDPA